LRRKPDRMPTKGLSVAAETILLQDWKTPFEMPPFAAIRDEDFMPAFQEAMKLHLAEVEEVASNAETPSFANTIDALERAGRGLQKVSSVSSILPPPTRMTSGRKSSATSRPC
jgi:Zn-dependent oligopeptidase